MQNLERIIPLPLSAVKFFLTYFLFFRILKATVVHAKGQASHGTSPLTQEIPDVTFSTFTRAMGPRHWIVEECERLGHIREAASPRYSHEV